MKKKVIIIISIVLFVAIAIGGAYAIDVNRMQNNKPVLFSTWGRKYVPPENRVNADEEQSFVGKVLEETTTYMIVEPANDEYERTVAENRKIEYGSDHMYIGTTDIDIHVKDK